MNLTQCLIPEFQEYTDQFGMVQIGTNGVSGNTSDNGNLWTAFYILGLYKKGLVTVAEQARLIQVYSNNFKEPGLLTRYPGSPDFEAQDDYCGLLMADSMLIPKLRLFSANVYSYGENTKHCVEVDPREPNPSTLNEDKQIYTVLKILTFNHIKWNYNCVSPNSFSIYSWLGRRMELIAAIQMSARKPVNPFYWLYWAVIMIDNILSKPVQSNSVADMLHYCNAVSCDGYGPLTNLICKWFFNSVKKKFGDVGYMFGWSNGQMNHPLVSFLKGVV